MLQANLLRKPKINKIVIRSRTVFTISIETESTTEGFSVLDAINRELVRGNC